MPEKVSQEMKPFNWFDAAVPSMSAAGQHPRQVTGLGHSPCSSAGAWCPLDTQPTNQAGIIMELGSLDPDTAISTSGWLRQVKRRFTQSPTASLTKIRPAAPSSVCVLLVP